MTGPFPVVASGCLHPPGQDEPRNHMCVHGTRLWVRGPDGWYRIGASRSRSQAWLDACDTWDDVLACAWELRLDGPVPG